MPRLSRAVFAGIPHHITQRGNRREDIFFTDEDREAYLAWLWEYCDKYEVEILAYCLMTHTYIWLQFPLATTACKGCSSRCTCAMPNASTVREAGQGTSGKGGSFHRRLTMPICGRQYVTSNAILSVPK